MKLKFLFRPMLHRSAFTYDRHKAYLLRDDNSLDKSVSIFPSRFNPNAGRIENDIHVRLYVPYELVKL